MTGLLILAAGLVSVPAAPSLALPPANADDPPSQFVPGTPHSEHGYESAPGVPLPGPPAKSGPQREAAGTASAAIKVKLVTAKLADDKNTVSMTAAEQAVAASSNYWKSMSNSRISMTVASRITGHQSAARSTQSYYDIINQITKELNWSYSTNTALVVFIPSTTLSYGALGAGYSSNGNSGRVLMPQISYFTHSVITHEFGHVLGSMHADALQCGSGAADVSTTSAGQFTDSSCYIREYGDTTDLMGASRYDMPVISSTLWDSLGLGRGDEIRNLGVATGVKSYTLKPWGGTLANRAVKFTDPVSREVYYLELRQPVGYDQYLGYAGNEGNNGVKIVQPGGATTASSLILMPSTKPFSGYYSPNHAWQAGSTFTTHTGTKVTITSATADSATVTINADQALRTRIQFSAGDFNGDARADVISRESDGSLLLHPGQTGNRIGSPVTIGAGWNIFNTVLGSGDFDGDKRSDVIARSSDGVLWLYPGNGTGGFLTRKQIGTGWQIYARIVAPGDFTGDGKADLFGVRFDGTLWLYAGNAAGGYQPAKQIGSGWQNFTALTPAGGFTGKLPGLMARGEDGALYLYPGNGAGGFRARTAIGAGWNSFKDLLGGQDFTGDGRTDVLVTTAAGTMAVYPGDGNGRFASRLAIGAGWNRFSQVLEADDFTGDGRPDVLARTPQGALWLHPGNGSGSFQAERQIGSGWQTFNQVINAGNFNGSGGPDLVARAADGTLWMYPTDGKGRFLARKLIGTGWQSFTRILSPGDFTGDGRTDIIGQAGDGRLWLYPGNGAGGFQAKKAIGSGWNIFNEVVRANDFNGDGKADIMARTYDGTLWLYPGSGASGFLPRKQLGTGWNIYKSFASVGRFAGTASPSIIAPAPDGVLWLYSGSGRGTFQTIVINPR